MYRLNSGTDSISMKDFLFLVLLLAFVVALTAIAMVVVVQNNL